jgi:hypothetical protein
MPVNEAIFILTGSSPKKIFIGPCYIYVVTLSVIYYDDDDDDDDDCGMR